MAHRDFMASLTHDLLTDQQALTWSMDRSLRVLEATGSGLVALGWAEEAVVGVDLAILFRVDPARRAAFEREAARVFERRPSPLEVITCGYSFYLYLRRVTEAGGAAARGFAIAAPARLHPKVAAPDAGAHTTLLNHLSGMAYRCRNDAAWTMEVVSQGCEALTGYSVDELRMNRTVAFGDLVYTDDVDWLWAKCQRNLGDRVKCDNIYRIRTKDGALRWVRDQAHGVYSDDGELQFIEGLVTDVTPQQQASRQLEESQRRLELALRAGDLGLWTLGVDSQSLELSERTAEMLSLPDAAAEVPLETWLARVHPDDRQVTRASFDSLCSGARAAADMTLRVPAPDDRVRTLVVRGAVVECDEAGAPVRVSGTCSDVTREREALAERAAIQRQLRHAQRLHSVGQLTGGVAHDFNNLLQLVLGHVTLLADTLPPGAPAHDHIDPIIGATTRARALVRQLLTYSQPQRADQAPLSPNDVVSATLQMLRPVIPAHVVLVFTPDPDVGLIEANTGQLEQILTNLILNANQAMPTGGTLTITTTRSDLATPPIADVPPDHVVLRVEDTGVGMTPQVLEHALEPFFTTRAAGQGSGLGLAMVQGLVREQGGTLEIRSALGRGTTVTMCFPRATAGRPAAAAAPAPLVRPRVAANSRAVVLLADDQDDIRRLIAQILASAGCEVVEARDGVELVERFRVHEDRIDLVMTDVTMPRMSGPVAAAQVRELRPTIPLIFLTGNANASMLDGFIRAGGATLLRKPVAPSDILRSVQDAMARSRD